MATSAPAKRYPHHEPLNKWKMNPNHAVTISLVGGKSKGSTPDNGAGASPACRKKESSPSVPLFHLHSLPIAPRFESSTFFQEKEPRNLASSALTLLSNGLSTVHDAVITPVPLIRSKYGKFFRFDKLFKNKSAHHWHQSKGRWYHSSFRQLSPPNGSFVMSVAVMYRLILPSPQHAHPPHLNEL